MPTFLELFNRCRNGDRSACQQLVSYYWYGHRLTKELLKVFGPVAIVPIPRPRPGSDPPLLDSNILHMGEVVRLAMGDPNPQPSLQATKDMRSAMERMLKTIDDDIRRLNPKSKT